MAALTVFIKQTEAFDSLCHGFNSNWLKGLSLIFGLKIWQCVAVAFGQQMLTLS